MALRVALCALGGGILGATAAIAICNRDPEGWGEMPILIPIGLAVGGTIGAITGRILLT